MSAQFYVIKTVSILTNTINHFIFQFSIVFYSPSPTLYGCHKNHIFIFTYDGAVLLNGREMVHVEWRGYKCWKEKLFEIYAISSANTATFLLMIIIHLNGIIMPLNCYKFAKNLLGRSTLMINIPNVRFQCKLLMSTIPSSYCYISCANISHPITWNP